MISNHEDIPKINPAKQKKLKIDSIKFLWSINHNENGWISAVATYKDEFVYVQGTRDNIYVVLRLSDDDYHRLNGNRIIFEYYVGTQYKLLPDGTRHKDWKQHSYANWEHYESLLLDNDIDLREKDIVGYFEK